MSPLSISALKRSGKNLHNTWYPIQTLPQLLEKKRSINDMCDNIECVCSLMTTVGQKLDTQKARVSCVSESTLDLSLRLTSNLSLRDGLTSISVG